MLTPTSRAPAPERGLGLGKVVHLHQRRQPQLGAVVEEAQQRIRSSAATMSRTASAPAARASSSWYAIEDEVLAQQRDVHRRPHRPEVVERAAEARARR